MINQLNTKTELITAPASLPVTLPEMRAQVWELDPNRATDTYLTHLISAATDYIERITWRKIVSQQWAVYLDCWPVDHEGRDEMIQFPFVPVSDVESVTITDSDGDERVLDASEYYINLFGAYPGILPTDDGWSIDTLTKYNGIKIIFTCGWTKNSIPTSIKHAILLLGEHWHKHASPVVIGASVEEVPMTVDALLSSWMPVL